jgi:hypothetical protein
MSNAESISRPARSLKIPDYREILSYFADPQSGKRVRRRISIQVDWEDDPSGVGGWPTAEAQQNQFRLERSAENRLEPDEPPRMLEAFRRTEPKETAKSRERAPHYPSIGQSYAYLASAGEARELEDTFLQLSRQWREERPPSSFVEDLVLHPAYQRIIGLGQEIVPLILRELQQQPDHWFWALHCITGEDPVDTADAGNLNRMADAWVEWGRKRNLCR